METNDVLMFLKDKLDEAFVSALESKDLGTKRSYLNKMNILNISICNLIEVF